MIGRVSVSIIREKAPELTEHYVSLSDQPLIEGINILSTMQDIHNNEIVRRVQRFENGHFSGEITLRALTDISPDLAPPLPD